jgi:voltage-gated potassium channel
MGRRNGTRLALFVPPRQTNRGRHKAGYRRRRCWAQASIGHAPGGSTFSRGGRSDDRSGRRNYRRARFQGRQAAAAKEVHPQTKAWFGLMKGPRAGSEHAPMIFLQEAGTALLLVALTLWLQCGGIAALITWLRTAIAADIHKLGPFHIAALIVRLITAMVAVHVIEILLWASFYRWFCFPSWEPAFYFSACSYSTVGYGDVTLPLKWRLLGPLESITGVLMCGISASLLFAIATRLVGPQRTFVSNHTSTH